MKKFLLFIIFFFIISCNFNKNGIFYKSISEKDAYFNDIAVDKKGKVFICYKDFAYKNRLSVKFFEKNKWIYLGSPGFSPFDVIHCNIKISSNDIPYVAFLDHGKQNKLTVMYFKDNQWLTVGERGISKGVAENISLAIDNFDNIYVAYSDSFFKNRIQLKKYENFEWIDVINVDEFNNSFDGLDNSIKLKFDNSNTPYILYTDSDEGYSLKLAKISNSIIFKIKISNKISNYISFDIDSENRIYTVHSEEIRSILTLINKDKIEKQLVFNENNPTEYNCVTIGNEDKPYIAFMDNNSMKLTIKYLNDNKLYDFDYNFKDIKMVSYMNITKDKNKDIYIVFKDHENNDKAGVLYLRTQ